MLVAAGNIRSLASAFSGLSPLSLLVTILSGTKLVALKCAAGQRPGMVADKPATLFL